MDETVENNISEMETVAPTLVVAATSVSEPASSGCLDDPNFATICSFMEKFGETCRIDAFPFAELQEMIENTTEVALPLVQLHIRLLRRVFKSIATDKWERSLAKFGHTYCSQDGWEIERFGYKKAKIQTKLRLLKNLLESQFDYNIKFKAEVNKIPATDLRLVPLGRDTEGQLYWYQVDADANLRVYREDVDDETWEIVASSREEMTELISQLQRGEVKKPIVADDEVVAEEDSNEKEIEPKEILLDTGKIEEEPSEDEMDEEPDWKEDDDMSIDDEAMEIDEDYIAPEQISVDTTIKCNSTIDSSNSFNNISDSFSLKEEKVDISTKAIDLEIREFDSYKTVTTIGSEKENFDKNDPKVEPLRLKKEKLTTEKIEKTSVTKEDSVQPSSETQVNELILTSTETVRDDKIEKAEVKSENVEVENNKIDFPAPNAPLFKKDDNIQNLKPEYVPVTKDEIKSSPPNDASFEKVTEQPLLSSEITSSPDDLNTEPISIKVNLNIDPIPEISNVNALITPLSENLEKHSHVKLDSDNLSSHVSTVKSISDCGTESDQRTSESEPLKSAEPIPVSVELSISISEAIPSTKSGNNALEILPSSDVNTFSEVVQNVLPMSTAEKSLVNERVEEKTDVKSSILEPTTVFSNDNSTSSFVSNYKFNDHHIPVPQTTTYGEVEKSSLNVRSSPVDYELPSNDGNQKSQDFPKTISVSRPSLDVDEIDSDDDAMEIAEDFYPENLSKDSSSNESYKCENSQEDKSSLPCTGISSEQISSAPVPVESNTYSEVKDSKETSSVYPNSLSDLAKDKGTREITSLERPNLPFNYNNLHAIPEENQDLLIKDVDDKEKESAGKYKQQDVPGKRGSMTELLSPPKADDVITETSVVCGSSTCSELVGNSSNVFQHDVTMTRADPLSTYHANVTPESFHAYRDSISREEIPSHNKISPYPGNIGTGVSDKGISDSYYVNPPSENYPPSMNINENDSPGNEITKELVSPENIPENVDIKRDILSNNDDKPKEIYSADINISKEISSDNIISQKDVSSDISYPKQELSTTPEDTNLDSISVPKVASDVDALKPGISENVIGQGEHALSNQENLETPNEVCTSNVNIPKSENDANYLVTQKENFLMNMNTPKEIVLGNFNVKDSSLENIDAPKVLSLENIDDPQGHMRNIDPPTDSTLKNTAPKESVEISAATKESLENIPEPNESLESASVRNDSEKITEQNVSVEIKESLKNFIPKESFENLTMPKESLENFVVPKGSLENFAVPKESLENFNVPKESLKNITLPNESLENITILKDSFGIAPVHKETLEDTTEAKDSFEITPVHKETLEDTTEAKDSFEIAPEHKETLEDTTKAKDSFAPEHKETLEDTTEAKDSVENVTELKGSLEKLADVSKEVSSENICPDKSPSESNNIPKHFISESINVPQDLNLESTGISQESPDSVNTNEGISQQHIDNDSTQQPISPNLDKDCCPETQIPKEVPVQNISTQMEVSLDSAKDTENEISSADGGSKALSDSHDCQDVEMEEVSSETPAPILPQIQKDSYSMEPPNEESIEKVPEDSSVNLDNQKEITSVDDVAETTSAEKEEQALSISEVTSVAQNPQDDNTISSHKVDLANKVPSAIEKVDVIPQGEKDTDKIQVSEDVVASHNEISEEENPDSVQAAVISHVSCIDMQSTIPVNSSVSHSSIEEHSVVEAANLEPKVETPVESPQKSPLLSSNADDGVTSKSETVKEMEHNITLNCTTDPDVSGVEPIPQKPPVDELQLKTTVETTVEKSDIFENTDAVNVKTVVQNQEEQVSSHTKLELQKSENPDLQTDPINTVDSTKAEKVLPPKPTLGGLVGYEYSSSEDDEPEVSASTNVQLVSSDSILKRKADSPLESVSKIAKIGENNPPIVPFNPIVGETIEEDVMTIEGQGSGAANEGGNNDRDVEANETIIQEEKEEHTPDIEVKKRGRGRPKKNPGTPGTTPTPRGRPASSAKRSNSEHFSNANTPTTPDTPATSATPRVRKRELENLNISFEGSSEMNGGDLINDRPVRASRRIAQIRQKEEEERRKLEEEKLAQLKAAQIRKQQKLLEKKKTDLSDGEIPQPKIKKLTSKNKNKEYLPDPESESDSEEGEGEDGDDYELKPSKLKKRRRKRNKNGKGKRGGNPWVTSSSEDDEAVEEEEEYHYEEEEEELVFNKSDHEFSPESDLGEEDEASPSRHARTAKRGEEIVDKYAETYCDKCGKGDHPEWILLCDICDKGWHASCIRPQLWVIPEGQWFCPPCQHNTLIEKLNENLIEYEKILKRRENEVLRKQRLAYVGISLDNVLPGGAPVLEKEDKEYFIEKSEKEERQERYNQRERKSRRRRIDSDDDEDDMEGDDFINDDDSEKASHFNSSAEESDEPIYKLRARRATKSFNFKEYDEMINSALRVDDDGELEGMETAEVEKKPEASNGKGKSMGDDEESEEHESDPGMNVGENGEVSKVRKRILMSAKRTSSDEPAGKKMLDEDTDEEELDEKEKNRRKELMKHSQRKTKRRLNDLDAPSDEDEDSDEDFQGSGGDDDDEDEEEAIEDDSEWSGDREADESDDSIQRGARNKKQGRLGRREKYLDVGTVRRSTRRRKARISYDESDEDGEEDGSDKWQSDESEESESNSESDDETWGKKKKRKTFNPPKTKFLGNPFQSKPKPKKKKRKVDDDDVDRAWSSNAKKKSAEEPVERRTRGRKINFKDILDSGESDDDGNIRPKRRRILSDSDSDSDAPTSSRKLIEEIKAQNAREAAMHAAKSILADEKQQLEEKQAAAAASAVVLPEPKVKSPPPIAVPTPKAASLVPPPLQSDSSAASSKGRSRSSSPSEKAAQLEMEMAMAKPVPAPPFPPALAKALGRKSTPSPATLAAFASAIDNNINLLPPLGQPLPAHPPVSLSSSPTHPLQLSHSPSNSPSSLSLSLPLTVPPSQTPPPTRGSKKNSSLNVPTPPKGSLPPAALTPPKPPISPQQQQTLPPGVRANLPSDIARLGNPAALYPSSAPLRPFHPAWRSSVPPQYGNPGAGMPNTSIGKPPPLSGPPFSMSQQGPPRSGYPSPPPLRIPNPGNSPLQAFQQFKRDALPPGMPMYRMPSQQGGGPLSGILPPNMAALNQGPPDRYFGGPPGSYGHPPYGLPPPHNQSQPPSIFPPFDYRIQHLQRPSEPFKEEPPPAQSQPPASEPPSSPPPASTVINATKEEPPGSQGDGEFGGLVSYFSSQRSNEEDLDT